VVGRLILAIGALVLLAACASPEATRVRAGGQGADVGNRGAAVSMHEGSHPYWNTPRIPGITGPPLDSGRHAARTAR
jgi:hypothetical protein